MVSILVSKTVPSRQMPCITTASLRDVATVDGCQLFRISKNDNFEPSSGKVIDARNSQIRHLGMVTSD